MKIINEKGMLFNRVNIIDFLVFLFILCLMPMGFFTWKILTKEKELSPALPTTITIEKVVYEQEQAKYEKAKIRLEKLDIWLIENKRARKDLE